MATNKSAATKVIGLLFEAILKLMSHSTGKLASLSRPGSLTEPFLLSVNVGWEGWMFELIVLEAISSPMAFQRGQ